MRRAAPLLAQIGAVVVWATTFVVSSDALASISPGVLTVLRFAVAGALLVPLALRRGGLGRVLRSRTAAALGLTGVAGYYGLQNIGLLTTPPGAAALLQAVLPVAATVLAVAVLRERPTIGGVVGLSLATVGVVLVASASETLGVGGLFIVAGVLAYAIYTVLLRRVGMAHDEGDLARRRPRVGPDAVVLAAATALWGLVFLMPWLLWEIVTVRATLPATPDAIVATLYLGLIASGGTLLLWTYGAARVPASLSGVLTAAIPALGYLFAVAAGEQPTWAKTIGGILAVTGVLTYAFAARARPGHSSAPIHRRRFRV